MILKSNMIHTAIVCSEHDGIIRKNYNARVIEAIQNKFILVQLDNLKYKLKLHYDFNKERYETYLLHTLFYSDIKLNGNIKHEGSKWKGRNKKKK